MDMLATSRVQTQANGEIGRTEVQTHVRTVKTGDGPASVPGIGETYIGLWNVDGGE